MGPLTAGDPELPQRISIRDCFIRTLGAFGELLKALENSDGAVLDQLPREILEDQIGYFRLWAGTNGAHRTGRASLDHKLRLASHIHDKVAEDLGGLEQVVNKVRELVLKNEGCRSPSPVSISSSSSFSEDEDLPTTTPLQYRIQEVQQRIKGLMRLSAVLRQPASRNLTARYTEISMEHYEKWDLNYVRDKLADMVRGVQSSEVETKGSTLFELDPWSLSDNVLVTGGTPTLDCDDHSHQLPDLDKERQSEAAPDPPRVYYQPPEYLAVRLAKANTERRQLLQYLKRHYQRISVGIESIPIDVVNSKTEIGSKPQVEDQDAFQDVERKTTTSSRKTGTTNPTLLETDSLIGYMSALSYASSEDGATDISFATSEGRDVGTGQRSGPRARLEIPLPPRAAEPLWEREFLCPLCWYHTGPTTSRAWRRHVMRDIKPYICTFEHCPAGSRLFDSRRAWYSHEQQYHRREWCCSLCGSVHRSREAFKLHLRDAHPEQPPFSDSTITLCERTSASDQQCSICGIICSSRYLQRHMGRHMEQLALFIVRGWWEPIEEDEDEEDEKEEEEWEEEEEEKEDEKEKEEEEEEKEDEKEKEEEEEEKEEGGERRLGRDRERPIMVSPRAGWRPRQRASEHLDQHGKPYIDGKEEDEEDQKKEEEEEEKEEKEEKEEEEKEEGGYDYSPYLCPPSTFHKSSENLGSINTTQRVKLYDPDRFDPSQEQRAYVVDTTHNLTYDIIIRKSDEEYIVLVPVDLPQIKVPEHWKNIEDLGPAYGTDNSHISHCRKLTRHPRNLGRCFCFPVQYGNELRIPAEAYDRQQSEE